ncbi:DNA polymerase III, partial [Candidatus Parcubacteria bacterium]|nr:DNA polymerase III [Candidatus Parcubacteria bacterium]
MSRPLTNKQIADRFEEIALYLRAQNIAFKPQAFEVAAEGIRALSDELSVLYNRCGKKCLDEIPGIGKSMAEKIEEALTHGRIQEHDAMKKRFPFDMRGMTQIQDVGPKTALALYTHLGVKTLVQLERAAKQGHIAGLPRMGISTQQSILRGIQFLKGNKGRQIIHRALPYARQIVNALKQTPGVKQVDIAGSLRRRKETIGDIDLIATTDKPKELAQAFATLPQVANVLERGQKRMAVRFKNGMDGDLLMLPPSEYASALVHFTGSREHNILLRSLAKKKGMKLSEHGLFQGKTPQAIRTERDLYAALGLK